MRKYILIWILFFSFLTLASAFTIGKFSIKAPNFCGDNVIGGNEECDGANLSGSSCISKGYGSGAISCTSECTLNESLCTLLIVPSKTSDSKECNDGLDNDGDNKIDFPNDPGCTNYLDNSEKDTICDPNWQVGEWGECIEELQIRTAVDLNHCKSNDITNETQQCKASFIDKLVPDEYIIKIPRDLAIKIIIAVIIVIILIIFFLVFRRRNRRRKQDRKKRHRFK